MSQCMCISEDSQCGYCEDTNRLTKQNAALRVDLLAAKEEACAQAQDCLSYMGQLEESRKENAFLLARVERLRFALATIEEKADSIHVIGGELGTCEHCLWSVAEKALSEDKQG